MATSTALSYSFSDSFVSNKGRDIIVIAESKETLISCFTAEDKIFSETFAATELAFLRGISNERLSSVKDKAASIETYIAALDGPSKVTLALLPSACSRHNTPSKSHAVSSVVKSNKGSKDLVVILIPSAPEHIFAQAVAVGRNFNEFTMKSKLDSNEKKTRAVDVIVHYPRSAVPDADELIREISHAADGVRLAQRLIDAPPNVLHTDEYVNECRYAAERIGCKIQIIGSEDLEAMGCGGIWGVGKSSEHLPALVILSHVPAGFEDKPSVCLVGKGIVYDTGGLSIKVPTTSMAGMKSDMGGSAAVLGAFEAAVRSNVPGPYHALLCIAENSVGPLSTRPDDVHTMLSGKTVEVNNTDAEGRLVLSDGVFYAYKYLNPKVIVDIATLTGAQLIATGRNHAAIYCSDEELEAAAVRVGKQTGDLVHAVPYCPEFYRKEFASQIADMKNSVADRQNAQASCAAQFIGNHLEEYLVAGGKWLHVDMAGPAMSGERATGYGVALLFALLKNLNA
jgi:probable aminopeptidase NPEPL1